MDSKFKLPAINSFYRCGVLLLIIKMFLDKSWVFNAGDVLDDIIAVAAAGCLLLNIFSKLLNRYFSSKALLVFSGVFLAAVVSTVLTGTWALLLVVVLCIASCGEKAEELVDFIMKYEILFTAVNVGIAILLIPEGYSMVTMNTGAVKYNFGFTHPNVFSAILINITCMWIWLNYDRIRNEHIGITLIAHIIFFRFTDCKTSLIIVILLCAMLFIFRAQRKLDKALTVAAAAAMPVISLAYFTLTALYTRQFKLSLLIDDMLTARIRLASYIYEHYGISLFGQNLENITVKWEEPWRLVAHTFDDVYSYLIVNQGVVWLAALCVLFALVARKGVVRHNIMLVIWCVHGITEVHGFNPVMLFPILLIAVLFRPAEDSDGDLSTLKRFFKRITEKLTGETMNEDRTHKKRSA